MNQPVEYKVSNNRYESLYIDVTNRCNMSCSFCYSSKDRSAWDMPLDYFTEVCSNLPQPINMRFVGGEPTLHPDFFKLVSVAREHGHHVHCSSNGLNYDNDHFMEQLAPVNGSFGVGLTMDGGTSNRQAYIDLSGADYLDEKLNLLTISARKTSEGSA